jgi:hypothetical protein
VAVRNSDIALVEAFSDWDAGMPKRV